MAKRRSDKRCDCVVVFTIFLRLFSGYLTGKCKQSNGEVDDPSSNAFKLPIFATK